MRRNKQEWMKQIIVMIVISLGIGLFFGMILLKLSAKKEGSNDTEVVQQSEVKQTNLKQDKEEKLKELKVYVVQAGMFTEKENADELVKSLKKENIAAIIWQVDQEYFVYLGLASTKELADQFLKQLAKKEEAFFIKNIEVATPNIVSATDAAFIKDFQDKWQQALQDMETNEAASWPTLIETETAVFSSLSSFYKEVAEEKVDSVQGRAVQLLSLLLAYEKSLTLLKNEK